MGCECKTEFNKLSKSDKVKLQGAALTKAITGFVRDDTKDRPWLYPFYVTYIMTIATPLPFFGAGTVVVAGTAAWAKYGKSERAKELHGRITDSFNEASLYREHKDVIENDAEKSDRPRVRNLGLIGHTAKAAAKDSWEATKIAYDALKRSILPK